ncbi:hypothetical protein ACFL01_04770 [Planctomycetota bacterium]
MAIITLLAAIILPGLARAREYAYFTRCKNNLKQVAIGLLIYAGDNRGRPAVGGGGCGTPSAADSGHRRTGGESERWMYSYGPGVYLLKKIFADPPGIVEDGSPDQGTTVSNSWVGARGDPGKYLPVEVLWDPILKVRDWAFGHNSLTYVSGYGDPMTAGDEKGRDNLTRGSAIFGYMPFVYAVGCDQYHKNASFTDHVATYAGGGGHWSNCEEPYRYMTKHREPHTSNPGSVWLAACLTPMVEWSGVVRHYRSHFSYEQTIVMGWRFNAVHLDGHVHDDYWREYCTSTVWVGASDWGDGCPYGWAWKNGANGVEGILADTPNGWAFDKN